MIWATVSSWSCFCWPYRASPSLAAKNIINLISVLTIWWCLCVESWVAPRAWLSFIELDKAVVLVWFDWLVSVSMVSVCLPSDALLQHLPSYLGFSYLGREEKHPLPKHKRRPYTWTSPDGQHWNQIDYILCTQRWRSSIQSAKTRPGTDCGSDHELLIAKFRLK